MSQTLSEALGDFARLALDNEAKTNAALQTMFDSLTAAFALRSERMATAQNVLREAQKCFSEASLGLADAISQVEVCEVEAQASMDSLAADLMTLKLINTPRDKRNDHVRRHVRGVFANAIDDALKEPVVKVYGVDPPSYTIVANEGVSITARNERPVAEVKAASLDLDHPRRG